MLTHHTESGSPERVTIMGSGGFVGGAAAARLAAADIDVTGLTRGQVDLLDDGATDALAGYLSDADSLVVTSALAPCRNNQELLLNVRMMLAVCDALKKVEVSHVVYVSSDAVYADGPLPLDERSCAAPTSLHGAMHVAREMMLRATVAEDHLCILRPSLLYGTADPHNGYGPNRFRRWAEAGEDITLFGNGEERRDHVLIDDVAEILALCISHRSAGVLNVTTGDVASFRDIAELVCGYFDPAPKIRATERHGPMPHGGYRPFRNDACRAAFPDFHYTSLAEGLAKVIRESGEAK